VLEDLPRYAPELAERFQSARLEGGVKGFSLPLALRRWPMSGEGFLLCGDAAALVDPLSGHGIDYAMISGALAAAQLRRCFGADRFDGAFMRQYDRAVWGEIGFELGRNALIMRTLSVFPWLLRATGWVGRYERQLNWIVRKLHL
jgi:flavin-dependent dehydrogenase